MVEAVSHIQPQSVDVKLIYPALDAGKEVCDDILVVQIQLYEIIIPFPALIPQPVVIIGIPVKTDMTSPCRESPISSLKRPGMPRNRGRRD